jgi:hypothetical protein
LPRIGLTLINLSVFYQIAKINKKLSLEYVKEAIDILLPFKDIGYVKNHLEVAYEVLENWNINPEIYLKEKQKELRINIEILNQEEE